MTVRELNREQLDELKNNLFWNLDGEQYGDLTEEEKEFILNAIHPNEIPDELVLKNYDGIYFVEDDFFCGKEGVNMDKIVEVLANKWYFDCLVYNIPVSPSDIKDIVEELLKTKTEKEEWEED